MQNAYLILRDPKTRAHYDETGEAEIAPDNELAEISTLIVGSFDEATATCTGQFDSFDLVGAMRNRLGQRLFNAKQNLADLVAGVGVIERIAKRLSYKGDRRDVIGAMLESRLAENRRAQSAVKHEIDTIERAQEYAKDYGYAFDPASPSPLAGMQQAAAPRYGGSPDWFQR